MLFFITSGRKTIITRWHAVDVASIYTHVCRDVFLDTETAEEKKKESVRRCCPESKRTIGL